MTPKKNFPYISSENARAMQLKSAAKKKENKEKHKLLSQIYGEFLIKEYEVQTPAGRKTITGEELCLEVVKKVLARGDSSSVALLREIREATEGSKVQIASPGLDPDFMTYKIRKELFPQQQEIFDSTKKINTAMCSRRAGKTIVASRMLVNKLIEHYSYINDNPGQEVYFLVVAKTATQAEGLFRLKITYLLDMLQINYTTKLSQNRILIGDKQNGVILFSGSDTIDTVEKLRGNPILFFVIDEAGSQKYCRYLYEEILYPATQDFTNSQGLLIGTPPPIKNTFFERLYKNNPTVGKFHWTIADNVYIPNHKEALTKIKAETGLTDSDPLFRREYLGELVYDTDALVYKISDKNYYTPDELNHFVANHQSDIELLLGIDYGYSDSDAIVAILSSRSSKEKFLIYEYKQNHNSTDELIGVIKRCASLDWIPPEIKPYIPTSIIFYGDPGGGGSRINADASKAIAQDLTMTSQVQVVPAYKVDKLYSIDKLATDFATGNLRIPRNSKVAEECDSTIWQRDENYNIVKVIDDVTYHPDLLDALRYALRDKWAREEQQLAKDIEEVVSDAKLIQEKFLRRTQKGLY